MAKMTKENLEKIIQKSAQEAAKLVYEMQLKRNKDKVFHNTKLLMENYNDLKKHAEKGIDSLNFALYDGKYDKLSDDEIYILSIKRSKAKTLVMLAHIDMALSELRRRKARKGTMEQYNVFEMYFIKELSYEEIQDKLHCGKNTPSRWVNNVLDELGPLLFGVEGIKLESIV